MKDQLVACDYCGVVYEMIRAGKFVNCPTCDTTADSKPIPGIGRVNKWWSKVDDE